MSYLFSARSCALVGWYTFPASTPASENTKQVLARECRRTKNVISVGIIIISLSRVRFSHRAHNGASLLCGGAEEHTRIYTRKAARGGAAAAATVHLSLSSHYFIYRSPHVYIWVAPDNNKSVLSLSVAARKKWRGVCNCTHIHHLHGSWYASHVNICARPPSARTESTSNPLERARPPSPSLPMIYKIPFVAHLNQ